MVSSSGTDFKNQVLQAINIVELIGRTVALKQRGRKFVGLCPFHQEKSPSFNVDQAKQYFFCFGCKAGGNAIDFVMQRDRIEFIDALKLLGVEAGVEMPTFGVSKQRSSERHALLDMQSAACAFFEKLLSDPNQGRAARDYLATRGIDPDSIKRFQIGVAPDAWDGLLTSPLVRKFAPPELVSGGLLKSRERGVGHYDTFRNRLMFPIRDENARVIAFGGRKLPGSQDPAKYLNSPETPLFSKSRCVYGLDLARQRIIETRTAVVVEGYTDVVMAHQFQVRNVVSVLGTALTEQHVTMLRRFADRIVLLFDADAAGDAAVDRAVALFLTQPVEIAIASMPSGVDPDEFLLKNGADAFQKVLDAATDALAFKWKQLQASYSNNENDLTGRQRAVSAYLDLLASARQSGPIDSIRWGVALARVGKLTGIPVDDLNRRFTLKPGQTVQATGQLEHRSPVAPPLSADQRAAQWVLGVLMVDPRKWATVQHQLGPADFADARYRRLAEIYWNLQRDEGEPVFSEFLGVLQDPSLIELAIQSVDEVETSIDQDQTLRDGLSHLKRQREFREEQGKLVIESERISGDAVDDPDEILFLRRVEENALRANLRRV